MIGMIDPVVQFEELGQDNLRKVVFSFENEGRSVKLTFLRHDGATFQARGEASN